MTIFKTTILALLVCACTISENRNLIEYSINVEEAKPYELNDLFDFISIFPLETNDSSLITNIDKVVFNGKRIYILDKRQSSIIAFDSIGNMISKLHKVGRGPDEYVGIEDFILNKKENSLMILNRCTVKSYDYSGKYLGQFDIKESQIKALNRFEMINDNLYIFLRHHDDYGLVLFSKEKNKVIETKAIVPKWTRNKIPFNSNNPFFKGTDNVIYIEGFSNRVYRINENGCDLNYSWNFPGKNFPYEKFESEFKSIESFEKSKELIFNITKNYIVGFRYNLECKDWTITNCMGDGSQISVLFNRTSSKNFVINGSLSALLSSEVYITEEDNIAIVIDPLTIKQIPLHWFPINAQKLITNLKPTDNPVVLTLSIK